ncbi:MAG: ribonuclease H-like domain-containing protein [Anaerolineales bacterium]
MNIVFFDLETQNLFEDVGGRENVEQLRLACAVTWSTQRQDFAVYWEDDVSALIWELKSADRVVGFNIRRFDYRVLQPYIPGENLQRLPTLDMLDEITRQLGFRLGLDALASATLNIGKSADGKESVRWFRNGELEKVAEYCKNDVEITRRLYEFGRENGFLYYYSRMGSRLRVPVTWK